jgi:hypothetical protein
MTCGCEFDVSTDIAFLEKQLVSLVDIKIFESRTPDHQSRRESFTRLRLELSLFSQ